MIPVPTREEVDLNAAIIAKHAEVQEIRRQLNARKAELEALVAERFPIYDADAE